MPRLMLALLTLFAGGCSCSSPSPPEMPGVVLGNAHTEPHNVAMMQFSASGDRIVNAERWLHETVNAAIVRGNEAWALSRFSAKLAAVRRFARLRKQQGESFAFEFAGAKARCMSASSVLVCPIKMYAVRRSTPAANEPGKVHLLRADRSKELNLGAVFVRHTKDGFRVEPADLTTLPAQVTDVGATVWVSSRRMWTQFDVRITVTMADANVVVTRFPEVVAGNESGAGAMRLLEVSQSGVPCTFSAYSNHLLIEPAARFDVVTLRLRYAGRARLLGPLPLSDALVSQWFPHTWNLVNFDVTVFDETAPLARHIVAPGARSSATAPRGWRGYRWTHRGINFVAAHTDSTPPTEFEHEGVSFRVVGMSPGPTKNAAVAAITAFTKHLGKVPYQRVRIVSRGPASPLPKSELSGQLIMIDQRHRLGGPLFRRIIAHELAHLWFGGAIPPGSQASGRWWESVANYMMLWLEPPAGARELRKIWSERYTRVDAVEDVPLDARDNLSAAAGRTLSYEKGALLLGALEDRIGRAKVGAALKQLVADASGRIGSWADVVSALRKVAGESNARWFRAQLAADSAPDLVFDDVELDGDRVRATIVQRNSTPFDISVEVELTDGKRRERKRVTLTGKRTQTIIPGFAGATELRLDPDYRLPRRFDDDKTDIEQRVAVSLVPDRLTGLGLRIARDNAIVGATKGGSAARANIPLTRVIAVDGAPVSNRAQLLAVLATRAPGDTVKLSIVSFDKPYLLRLPKPVAKRAPTRNPGTRR